MVGSVSWCGDGRAAGWCMVGSALVSASGGGLGVCALWVSLGDGVGCNDVIVGADEVAWLCFGFNGLCW